MSQPDYYSFFKISPSFFPDLELVRQTYYENSKQFHPDVHGQSDDEAKQESVQMTSLNNEAYKTLSKFDSNLAYLLRLKGVMEAEEKYQLAPEFLMEMMDFNESIMEAKMDDDRDQLMDAEDRIEDLEADIQLDLESKCREYDKTQEPDLLPKIKDLYYRKKYLKRLWDNLDNEDPEL